LDNKNDYYSNFTLSQEDERTEATALSISDRKRVITIASAGEIPICLYAKTDGEIIAVDSDIRQLYLSQLKYTIVKRIDEIDALRFLGYKKIESSERKNIFDKLINIFPKDLNNFWKQNKEYLYEGVVHTGRYEKFIIKKVKIFNFLFKNAVRQFLLTKNRAQRQVAFNKHFNRWYIRLFFKIIFHPRIFARRGMDPRSLKQRNKNQSVGLQYFNKLRNFCVENPIDENYFFQMHFSGSVNKDSCVPYYLTPEGVKKIKGKKDEIKWIHTDVISYLKHSEEKFDAFHLSNVPDWLTQEKFNELLEEVYRCSEDKARVIWRTLHVNYDVPDKLKKYFIRDEQQERNLELSDRFPFYQLNIFSIAKDC